MRASPAALAATTAALLIATPASARVEGPWCAEYSLGFWVRDCSMPSFEACRQEVIAGNRGYCTPNARWQGAVTEPSRRRSVRHRRH